MSRTLARTPRLAAFRVVLVLATLSLAAAASVSAQGANIPNTGSQWQALPFDDSSPTMVPGTSTFICFRNDGTWFDVAGFGGNARSGRWDQKGGNAAGNGDEIRLRGNFNNGQGNEGAAGHFVALNIMSFKWEQWTDGPPNGQNFGFPFQVVLVATALPCPAGPITVPDGRALGDPNAEPIDSKDLPFRVVDVNGDIVP